MNDYEDIIYQNLWVVVKTVLREEFIAVNTNGFLQHVTLLFIFYY